MNFLSELNIKIYEVTKNGELREWTLDTNTMTFKTIGREYSANHIGADAVVVKVSNIEDVCSNKIEEGQLISDKYNNNYVVNFNDGCFVAINLSSKEVILLKDVESPKITKKYPKEISKLLLEIKREVSSEIYAGNYALVFLFNEDELKKEARSKGVEISSLRKKYLEVIDWEVYLLSNKQTDSNALGVYLKGKYTISNVNLNIAHEDIEEAFQYINDLIPSLKTIKLTPKN